MHGETVKFAVLWAICHYISAVHDEWCYNRWMCFTLKHEVMSVKKGKKKKHEYW